MQEEPRGVSIWGGVWPAVTNAAESGMRIMTALLRGRSGESVTGSHARKPPAHAWQVASAQWLLPVVIANLPIVIKPMWTEQETEGTLKWEGEGTRVQKLFTKC